MTFIEYLIDNPFKGLVLPLVIIGMVIIWRDMRKNHHHKHY